MKPSEIIIHHSLTKDSGTVSWGAIRRYHKSLGWDDIGYHYGIEKVGSTYEILVGRLMNRQGAHTRGHNHDSIGICVVGNFDDNDVPPVQWALTVELVKSLMETLGIKTVKGHREYASYKSCPGKRFDMHRFRDDIRQ